MSFGKRTPPGFASAERRLTRRDKRPSDAHIILNTGLVACNVADMSAAGARIIIAKTFGLPHILEIRIRGHTYRARIVRKAPREIAIRFI